MAMRSLPIPYVIVLAHAKLYPLQAEVQLLRPLKQHIKCKNMAITLVYYSISP